MAKKKNATKRPGLWWLVPLAGLNVYAAYRVAVLARSLELPLIGPLYSGPQLVMGILLINAAVLLLLAISR